MDDEEDEHPLLLAEINRLMQTALEADDDNARVLKQREDYGKSFVT